MREHFYDVLECIVEWYQKRAVCFMISSSVDHILRLCSLKHIIMIVCFQLIAFLVNEHFTPEWQKNVRDITREVIVSMSEANKNTDDSSACYLF